jgi:hypothetical protein
MRGTVRTATQTPTSTSNVRTATETFSSTPNSISSPISPSLSVSPSTFISPISPSPRIDAAAPPAIPGRTLRSTSKTTPNPISSPPSNSIAVTVPPAIPGQTVFANLGRSGEPNAFGNLPDYSKHLKGFTKKALDKCKEVVFDGSNGFRSVSHLDLDRSKPAKRDATQIDELADSMTRLERGSYRFRSAEGLDLVWVFEGLLSFNVADFPKMPESLREGIRNVVPDALSLSYRDRQLRSERDASLQSQSRFSFRCSPSSKEGKQGSERRLSGVRALWAMGGSVCHNVWQNQRYPSRR